MRSVNASMGPCSEGSSSAQDSSTAAVGVVPWASGRWFFSDASSMSLTGFDGSSENPA